MSGERFSGFAPEAGSQDNEEEKSKEYSFDYFSCYTGGYLTLSSSGASPKLLAEHPDLAESDVTGFQFVFGRGKNVNSDIVEAVREMGLPADAAEIVGSTQDKFKSVYAFVGAEITDYDTIKDLFKSDVDEEDKKRKYIVSKDAQGKIIDVRPILEDEEVHIVSNKNELFKLYEDVTGYSYPEKSE